MKKHGILSGLTRCLCSKTNKFGPQRTEVDARNTKANRGQETHPIKVTSRYEMKWANIFFFQKVLETPFRPNGNGSHYSGISCVTKQIIVTWTNKFWFRNIPWNNIVNSINCLASGDPTFVMLFRTFVVSPDLRWWFSFIGDDVFLICNVSGTSHNGLAMASSKTYPDHNRTIFPRKSATNLDISCPKVCPVASWDFRVYPYPVSYLGWVSESRKKVPLGHERDKRDLTRRQGKQFFNTCEVADVKVGIAIDFWAVKCVSVEWNQPHCGNSS